MRSAVPAGCCVVPFVPSLNDRRASQLLGSKGGRPKLQGFLQESEDHLCCISLVKQVTVANSDAMKGK